MKKIHVKTLILLASAAVLLPRVALASSVFIDTNHSEFHVGDTIMFNVRVDSNDQAINTVEGNILLNYPPGTASLVDINTAGSKFSVWPDRPSPSDDNSFISFVGGVPGGLTGEATIFNIVLRLQEAGQLALIPDGIGVYLHDGKGTRDKVDMKNLVMNVLPSQPGLKAVDDWGDVTASDKTPPEPFEILLGQDESVFGGKKFLSFHAVDKESGVKYYEVKEGGLAPVRSGTTYVLQEQEKKNKVVVTAFDAAGNARESVYEPAQSYYRVVIIGAVISLLLIAALGFALKKKRRKNGFRKQ